MQIHPLITDSASLSALCDRLSRSPFVAVDTEFMRENTFWPDLCLIQIADANEAAAIDPKASDLDLTPLLDLLVDNEDVLKVFHAGGQDIEIVYNITGKTPHPLFDTQIASMALSQGEQIGYGNLVEAWLGISLDKGARFTDWGRRPLDKRQIDYAIGDVTHLARLFPMMLEQLRKTGRGAWLDQEMERLADPANYALDPQEAWRRVRLSSRKPEEQADLGKVRGLSATWRTNDIGGRLMRAIESAEPLSRDEMPEREPHRPGPGKDGMLVADLLKLLLKVRSREINVAARLLARTDELELLAAGARDRLTILEGWRYEQFGHDALDLVEGRMAFAVRNGRLLMTRTEGTD
jgi:ribonuclease D